MKIKSLLFIGLVFPITFSAAGETQSYVDGSKPFVEIKDINRQAEAWATCAAAYDIMADVFESQPAQAKQLKELSSGAEMAVTMSLFQYILSKDITPERLHGLWTYAKDVGQALPESWQTIILADVKALDSEGVNSTVDNLSATVKICIDNLESQQDYIDSWRKLAKSGLLKLPEN